MVGEDGLIRVDCAFCSPSFPIALEDVSCEALCGLRLVNCFMLKGAR